MNFRFTWGAACPPSYQCELAHQPCVLGCVEDGARLSYGNEDVPKTLMMCEEATIRGPGFPCRADIDCATPVGAVYQSRLTNGESGLGGAPATDPTALHCVSEVCTPGAPTAPDDASEGCLIESSSYLTGPALGFVDSCTSGACLVLEGGAASGVCTSSCQTDVDCGTGSRCAEVLDNRYTTWRYMPPDLVPPPRILACVPN